MQTNDLCQIELLEIELFDHVTVYLQNVFANHVFNIDVKTGLMCHKTQPNKQTNKPYLFS